MKSKANLNSPWQSTLKRYDRAAGIELSNAHKNNKGFTSLPTDVSLFWLFSANLTNIEGENKREER